MLLQKLELSQKVVKLSILYLSMMQLKLMNGSIPEVVKNNPVFRCSRRMFLGSLITAAKQMNKDAPYNVAHHWGSSLAIPVSQLFAAESVFCDAISKEDLNVSEGVLNSFSAYLKNGKRLRANRNLIRNLNKEQ